MILFSNKPAAFTLTGGQHFKTSLGGVQYEVTVGIPRGLSLPSGFGIMTRFTGVGLYFPSTNSAFMPVRYFSIPIVSISSILIPSTPLEPLLAFTRFHASKSISSRYTLSYSA